LLSFYFALRKHGKILGQHSGFGAYHRLLVSYYLVPNERSTRGSRLLLPVHRIATAVETGDDGQRFVGFDDKHQRVGKVAQQSTANAFVDDRKLPGIGAHALDYGIDRRAEISAQAGSLVLVPVLRVDQLRAGNSARAARVKITGYTTGSVARAQPSKQPK